MMGVNIDGLEEVEVGGPDRSLVVEKALEGAGGGGVGGVIGLGHQGVIMRAMYRLVTTALEGIQVKDDRSREGWIVRVDRIDGGAVKVEHRRREEVVGGRGDYIRWSHTIILDKDCRVVESVGLRIEGVEVGEGSMAGAKVKDLLKGGSLIID